MVDFWECNKKLTLQKIFVLLFNEIKNLVKGKYQNELEGIY